jgi:hypothetical protein
MVTSTVGSREVKFSKAVVCFVISNTPVVESKWSVCIKNRTCCGVVGSGDGVVSLAKIV